MYSVDLFRTKVVICAGFFQLQAALVEDCIGIVPHLSKRDSEFFDFFSGLAQVKVFNKSYETRPKL